ncbi:MAG: GAF domain-containing protein [Nitrospinae bacterium]|nr:GAF domain-containing protein [Nitrospinota bacterium]
MPVMDGNALLNDLREAKNDVPLIMLTGDKDVTAAMESLKMGANDYLVKDNNLKDTVLFSVSRVLERTRTLEENKRLFAIGRALSSEHNIECLLELIVDEVRSLTHADGGTLYILKDNKLHFKIVQTASLNIRMGGTSGKEIGFPPVEMKESNVSAYVAMKGESINIDDVYTTDLFDFTGPKNFDKATGYRTKSMLVVPMKNHENDVIGVLQLLNSVDQKSGEVIPFSSNYEQLTESLASQAAVSFTNTKLIDEMQNLFESFVEVMATAIDEKSPVTGGHIKRVADMTTMLAKTLNEQTEGTFKDVSFSEEHLYELNIAAMMHDIGKVTTPVEIVEKATKLQTIFDRVNYVDLRFQYLLQKARNEGLQKKVQLIKDNASESEIQKHDEEITAKIEELTEMKAFVTGCNKPGEFMDDDKIERLQSISKLTYEDEEGNTLPYINEDELKNLSIRKGSITEEERKIMQNHASVSLKMLSGIPFTKNLQNVPKFAGAHHEFINGKGYPLGLKGDEIPFEGKMMAVTDIAEALTASDRPYKKAMPLEVAYKILRFMAKDEELDSDLVEFFINENLAVPIVDRIIHKSNIFMLGGESYRLRQKMKE